MPDPDIYPNRYQYTPNSSLKLNVINNISDIADSVSQWVSSTAFGPHKPCWSSEG